MTTYFYSDRRQLDNLVSRVLVADGQYQTFFCLGIVGMEKVFRFEDDKHSADDDDAQHEVLLWMRHQPKEFYEAGIGALMKRWDKCINIGGDYVQK
ncbi:hypothetical protein AVEN_10534-1 [Araneus ventricosus]|uniref:Uncharacterized protein n=1 Tax=Araneus ventricosus TaxID=182803 RepID=A0A4Y2G4G8_ARAVE|nr:hypothetical protein AVEN_10534-1 [Araneus ventricosus]